MSIDTEPDDATEMTQRDENEQESAQADERVLAQGEYIWYLGDYGRYKVYLVDGIPHPFMVDADFGAVMAMMDLRLPDGTWWGWEFAPHYWAGLICSDCDESHVCGYGVEYRFEPTHPWSGEWHDSLPSRFHIEP